MKSVNLRQVSPSPESKTTTNVDIIAIHGFDTKSPDAWTWDPEGTSINWLEHPHMLPKFRSARIFTCDWPADLLEQPDLIQKTIEEFAPLLLAGIKNRPPVTNNTCDVENRPIVFIASCLGGVVLINALVRASHEYLSVKEAIRGIIFLATPFRGTSFQDVAKWAEQGLRSWATIGDKRISNLLEYSKSTFDLGELVHNFTALCREIDIFDHVIAFYETGRSSLPHKIAPWLPSSWPKEQPLVDLISATPDFVPHPIPLDRPHVLMNKFCGPDDSQYKHVAGMVEHLLCNAIDGQTITKADVWMRNKSYSLKNLEIERLSGELLPMEQCYINLTIIKPPNTNIGRAEKTHNTQQSSPFSLTARLKLETSDKKIETTLPNLFEPPNTLDGKKGRPSRILIRGTAGVGKTTLCKKIVYNFTYGTLWRDLFDHVLWVPLRNLKLRERRKIPDYNLGHLLYHEYFSQHSEGNKLADILRKDVDNGKVLFILDGLDEVLQDLDGNMFCFLEELLNQPNAIITSRPNAMLPNKLAPLDLEVETIGLKPGQVTTYIENSFTNRETRKRDSEKIGEVQSFLQQHQLMQSLLRIPILLDAFCYTWNGHPRQDIPETMTAVYRDIEQSLWKKDAVNLEERNQYRMRSAHQNDAFKPIKEDLFILEVVAFTGMYNDAIYFESKHRKIISRHFGIPDTDFFLDDMLGRISFLRASDLSIESRDRNYHFLHLTFQEYFAARYFVRQWKTRKPLECLNFGNGNNKYVEPAAFLQKHKYDSRYNILWRFVAGLLDAEADAEMLLRFFETIEDEPRDLLGPSHQRLVMHCLSEVIVLQEDPAFKLFRKELEDQLSQWLLFECKLTNESQLAGEPELSQQVLENALQEVSGEAKLMLLKSISIRYSIPRSVIDLATSWLTVDVSQRMRLDALAILRCPQAALSEEVLKAVAARLEDEDRDVRRAAVEALGTQSALSEEYLKAVAAQLEDKYYSLKLAAGQVLQTQSALSEDVLKAVAARLEHEDTHVKWAAIHVLETQSTISEELLKAISALIKHEDLEVRRVAVYALKTQPTLSEEVLKGVAELLEHEDWGVRRAAAEALGTQSALSEEFLKVVASRPEDEDWRVSKAAVLALGTQSTLSEDVLKAVASQIDHEKSDLRWAALHALQTQSTLSEEILKAVVAQLEDEYDNVDEDVGQAAVRVLQTQSTLSEEVLKAIALRLEHEDSDVRRAAVEALGTQTALSEELLKAIAAQLDDESHRHLRMAAGQVLRNQSILSEEVLKAVAARLEHEDWRVRRSAVEALRTHSALSEEILKAVAVRLEDENSSVRRAAVQTLRTQAAFSEEALKAIAARLEDENSDVRRTAVYALRASTALSEELLNAVAARLEDKDSEVRLAAVYALRTQSTPSEELLKAVAARLEDEHLSVKQAAAEALGTQSALSENVLKAVAARLEDEDYRVRRTAIHTLRIQSALSEEVLKAVAARLEDEDWDVRGAAVDILMCVPDLSSIPNQYIKSLFKVLLRNSFKEHITWHVVDDTSCITRGLREYFFKGWHNEVVNAIRETQESLGLPFLYNPAL